MYRLQREEMHMNKQADVTWWATALILRHLRRGLGYAQKDVAKMSEIPISRYTRYENARSLPSPKDEVILCNILQIRQEKFQQLIQTEIKVLTGKIAAPGASTCIDYVALRNKK